MKLYSYLNLLLQKLLGFRQLLFLLKKIIYIYLDQYIRAEV